MYAALGIHWASSIPAFLALACVPFPFIFYKYGPAIRVRCKFAAEADLFIKKMRGEIPPDEKDGGSEDSASGSSGGEHSPSPVQDATVKKEIEAGAETSGNADAKPKMRRPQSQQRGRPLSKAYSSKSRREQDDYEDREAEAFDYSYEDEVEPSATASQARFQRIRTGQSIPAAQRQAGASGNASQTSFEYHHDPFTLDRVNTSDSFAGSGSRNQSRSRAASRGAAQAGTSSPSLRSVVSLGRLRSRSEKDLRSKRSEKSLGGRK